MLFRFRNIAQRKCTFIKSSKFTKKVTIFVFKNMQVIKSCKRVDFDKNFKNHQKKRFLTIFILNLEKNKETKVNIIVPSTARFLQGEIFSNADLQTISQMLVILCILVKKKLISIMYLY